MCRIYLVKLYLIYGDGHESILQSSILHHFSHLILRKTMPFHMPKVNQDVLSSYHKDIMQPIIDEKGNLKTCPSANSSDSVKLIHYYLIKMLYRMPGFSVPVAGAWGLPHIVRKISDDEYNIAEKTALDIIMTECFVGIPYPRLIEDNYTKVYICHDSNGKEFYLQV